MRRLPRDPERAARRIGRQSPYPLARWNWRVLDPSYAGPVYTFDIDKTYLDTHYDTVRDLLSTAFQFAVDKRTVPGMRALLRAVRAGPGSEYRHTPLVFVSASPVQLRRVIERKMLLDGVEHDGLTLKDQLAHLRALKVRRLSENVGYKMVALLLNRRGWPRGAWEVLVGDDSERDPETYALYARVLAGRRGVELLASLRDLGVAWDDAEYVLRLAADLPRVEGAVRWIFIRSTGARTPADIRAAGQEVEAFAHTTQLAVALWERGELSAASVRAVWSEEVHQSDDPLDPVAVVEGGAELELYGPDIARRWVRELGSP